MHLTINPLDRMPFDPADPGHDVSALLPGTPVAAWIGDQVGSITGTLVTVWSEEAAAEAAAGTEGTAGGTVLSRGTAYRLASVMPLAAATEAPGALQVTAFSGPRPAIQVRSDEQVDARIHALLTGLPGNCGALVGVRADGGRAVVSFALDVDTLVDASRRIVSRELGPEEDPALLTGPDVVDLCRVVGGDATIASFGDVPVGASR